MSSQRYAKAAGAATVILSLLLAACASTQSGNLRAARSDCPMGFTMSCDVKGRGANAEYSNCQCVRHKDIDEFLREW